MARPEITVVVCTRDRPELLARALASLTGQTLDRSSFEVVVVDNGRGAEEPERAAGADVVVREHVPGLSRARNAGWRAASADLVAYLDDDAVAADDWLQQALRLRGERGDALVAFGGPILPVWQAPPPSWFPERLEERTMGDDERVLLPGESLSGSNVFFRRSLLERLGGFDVRLGMISDRTGVGEEAELFARIWEEIPPPVVVYSPALVVRHAVAPSKLSVRYQLGRAVAYGRSVIIRYRPPMNERPYLAFEYARDVLALTWKALRRVRTPVRRWALDELEPAAVRLGMLFAVLRGK